MQQFVNGAGGILALAIVVVRQELDVPAFVPGESYDPIGRVGRIRPREWNVRDRLPQSVSVCSIFAQVMS